MERRVVVTGLGAITPIGNNIEEFWNGIKNSTNGIDEIKTFDTANCNVKLAAEVKNYNEEDYFDKKEAKRMDKFTQFALIASKEAAKDAGIDLKAEGNKIDPTRVGAIISTGIGGLITIQNQCDVLKEKGMNRVSPFFIPMSIANMAAGMVSIELRN